MFSLFVLFFGRPFVVTVSTSAASEPAASEAFVLRAHSVCLYMLSTKSGQQLENVIYDNTHNSNCA